MDINQRHRSPPHLRWCVALLALVSWVVAVPVVGMPASSSAARDESGLPFIRNYAPAEYGGATQNWAVVQDPRGVIYVGNVDDGLFTYDGSRWRRIPIPNRSAVRSLGVDAAGRVWVGVVGDLGYVAADAQGNPRFVSMLGRIPVADRQFTDVWRTLPTADGVYFSTRARIFRIAGTKVAVWKPRTAFHSTFRVRGAIYVREVDRGLARLVEGGTTRLIPGGERFAQEKVYVLLPWQAPGMGPDAMLVGTRTQGWLLFDGHAYRRWSEAADRTTAGSLLYDAVWLHNGLIAVVAPPLGVLLFDRTGRLIRRIDRASGLANNEVNALFEDRQHGLWVTSDLGVSRIALDTPIGQFDERTGLRGAVLALARHVGRLYAGGTEGLYRLDDQTDGGARFHAILARADEIWALEDTPHGLLVGGMHGVLAIDDGAPVLIWPADQTVFSLMRSRRDPARVFVGLQNGLASIRWDGRRWRDEGRIEGVGDEVRSMQGLPDGTLWLGSWNGHVLRVDFPPEWSGGASAPARVARFGAAEGLSAGQTLVIAIDQDVRFATPAGIFRFAAGRFVPDTRFAQLFTDGRRRVGPSVQDGRGRLWMYTAEGPGGLKETGVASADGQGRWHWSATALRPVAGNTMSALYSDPDGVVWLAGEQQELYRYDPADPPAHDAGFATLLRGVGTRDGMFEPGARIGQPAQLPYAQNALRFEFAAPSYLASDANRFQVRLDGLDGGWSDWTGEAYRDYTNLPAGDYRFRVRARDVYGTVGREASYVFRVLPPWYRTWWAWLLWDLLAVVLLALAVRWRLAALRRRNRELAALVERRTRELQSANDALAEQSITDPLTGLKNRRYLHDHIEQDVAMARRHYQDHHQGRASAQHMALLFLMVDIDHFKEVNDTYGHAAGDRVLQQLRDILLAVTRDSDTPIRWGGEEFLIVARFAPQEAGPQFAERIRVAVAAHRFDLGDGRTIHRTCSIGFASYPFFGSEPDRLNWEQVVNIADECLYAAKRHGRNAWVGVAPMHAPVSGDLIEALQASLAGQSSENAPPVLASWAYPEALEACADAIL